MLDDEWSAEESLDLVWDHEEQGMIPRQEKAAKRAQKKRDAEERARRQAQWEERQPKPPREPPRSGWK